MGRDGSRSPVGRWHSGWTVRLRLTALYSGLFLVSGGVLLGITYALVAHRLPSGGVFVARSVNGPNSAIRALIQAPPVKVLPGTGLQISGRTVLVPPPQAILGQVRALAQDTRSSALHQLLTDSGVALAVMVVFSSGLGWLVAGRALRPVRAMSGAAQTISEHNLHERLPETGPRDELRGLAASFNALLGRLEAAFDSQRRFVANASHELRTPLTLERAVVEVALADPDADLDSLRAMGARVLEIGTDQEATIEALITLARSQRGLDERRPVDLVATVEEVLEAAQARVVDRSVTVDNYLRPASISGDGRLIERMVANLVDNAVTHNYPGGWIRIDTTTDAGRATLRISNSGPAVAPGEIGRLLQAFQRGGQERAGHGTGLGLGLSIVDAIASAHAAQLTVVAGAAGGLDVAVTFAPESALDGGQSSTIRS